MPSHNQLTSTIIDDEELIDELRRYGEKNLPTSGSTAGTTSRKKATSNQLTDQNREIYLKKLNHYKAREKIETNPSKQYVKQHNFRKSLEAKRISNIYRQYDENDEVKDDDDDIIEIDSKNTTSEYVQVNNANTSPLSTSVYQENNNDDYYSSSILTSTINNMPTSPTIRNAALNPAYNGYVRLKDRIEIDKTLSKYRSEINSILNDSIARNRNSESVASKLYNVETKKEPEITTLHCPKPASENRSNTLFGSIKSKLFSPKPVNIYDSKAGDLTEKEHPYNMLKQIRGSHVSLRKDQIYSEPQDKHKFYKNNLNQQHLTTNIRKTNDDNFINTFGTFISNLGLQISKFLPYLVVIIFALIIIMYIGMKIKNNEPESLTASEANVKNVIDQVVFDNQKPKKENLYCSDVKDTKCSGTKDLLRELLVYLRAKSGTIDCMHINSEAKISSKNEPSVDFIEKCVHLNKVADYFTNNLNMIKSEDKNDAMDSMLVAILNNPHWNIRLLNKAYMDATDPKDVTYLMSTISSKSFMCRFKELVHFIWVRLVMFTSILITLITGYFVYSRIRLISIEKDKEYYDLITRVTAMVEQHYELSLLDPANIKPYIAISHIYDHLFDPSQRASKKKLWNKVVDFIQNHESRIHLETQFINGEETNVWKWIVPKHDPSLKYTNKNEGIGLANSTMLPNTDLNLKPTNRLYPNLPTQSQSSNFTQDQNMDQNNAQANGWQGDAFNRSDTLAHSPTPCLKIRNMFDSSSIENDPLMPIRIHNDILEKFTSNNAVKVPVILHIACDKKSKEGCVYIKCINNDSAGIVYQTLNGTWYNGKLLNVKFLRSDRYMERFPDSISYNQPLRPIIL